MVTTETVPYEVEREGVSKVRINQSNMCARSGTGYQATPIKKGVHLSVQ